MAEGKPRIQQGNRDMLWSVLILMAICAVFAGVLGLCSFSPSGPKQGPVPTFDAAASLRKDARTLGFEVREPAVPEEWTSNSGSVQAIDGSSSSHTGWVTADRAYLELVQSDAPLDAFRSLPGGPRPNQSMIPISGREWTVFSGDDVRPVWVANLGAVRVAVTGTAPNSDFETLAAAVQSAQPLPQKG